ncbi:bifunctional riboflavin kinase/FAD synthetase [Buchnera aphidicola (Hyperomyzus lactucae)]|uniref:Riboflavin biosynthesis protein n=1 Tax=Buchnera aphidicola (Hyperomyzus lactucae) TaxID=1241860 RepID=A0A4D6XXS6_9GAMM|nr:bifunctional riboflavin kinase/FAD synthetase [Buchnera aphidicola]QCI20887.1 bifunctional riboflavin kinase/FAD synthetase [Buchnera aphidicola (Hyperomyzus lactucae)]
MKIIRGIHNLKRINSSSVVTIGNFDGIHLGHQKLFSNTYEIGKKYQIKTIIILFEPQPLEFLKKQEAPVRITTFREKIKRILSYNFDKILCIKFNKSFSSLDPKDFIINILINKLRIKFIVVGNDFRFGCQRHGNIDLLKTLGKKHQFQIVQIKPLYINNIKVSSTNIRKFLFQNDIKHASLLLGRLFSIYGKVVHGSAIGRTIGYPTANILLNKNFLLSNGVYAVRVRCFSNRDFIGISNIGVKPSFINTQKNRFLETYLLDIKINLYRENIEIFIYKKIRNERFFSSKNELKNQISKDIEIVKKYFKNDKN